MWRQALTAADLVDQGGPDRYPLLIGLGASLYRAGNPHDGLPVFVQAMEAALAAGDGGPDTFRLVTAAVAAISELTWYPVSFGEINKRLVDVLEHALSQVTDPVQRALVLSCLTVARFYDGDPVDAPGEVDKPWT